MVGDVGVGAKLDEGLCDDGIAFFHGNVEWGIALVVLNIGIEVKSNDERGDVIRSDITGCVVEDVLPFWVGEVGVGVEVDEVFDGVENAVLCGDHEGCNAFVVSDIGV